MLVLYKVILLFLAIMTLSMIQGHCQQKTDKDELIALSEAQKKIKAFSVELEYVFYETYHSTNAVKQLKAFYKKDKENIYQSFQNYYELVRNKSHTVIANHLEKIVFIQKNYPIQSASPYPDMTQFNFDSLLQTAGVTYNVFNKENQQRKINIRFSAKSSKYSGIDITYSPTKGYAIDKYVIYFNEEVESEDSKAKPSKPRLEILCKNLQQFPSLPSSTFDIGSIVILRNNEYQLAPKYQSYRLFYQ